MSIRNGMEITKYYTGIGLGSPLNAVNSMLKTIEYTSKSDIDYFTVSNANVNIEVDRISPTYFSLALRMTDSKIKILTGRIINHSNGTNSRMDIWEATGTLKTPNPDASR